jgi:hypothetical protein
VQTIHGALPLGLEPVKKILVLGRCLAVGPPRALTRLLEAEPGLLFLSLDGDELVWLI